MKNQESLTEQTDDKKTVDLCGAEHEGKRCVRRRGHDGKHECLSLMSGHWVTWT